MSSSHPIYTYNGEHLELCSIYMFLLEVSGIYWFLSVKDDRTIKRRPIILTKMYPRQWSQTWLKKKCFCCTTQKHTIEHTKVFLYKVDKQSISQSEQYTQMHQCLAAHQHALSLRGNRKHFFLGSFSKRKRKQIHRQV